VRQNPSTGIVTYHTVNALGCFGKHKLLYPALAGATGKTVGVIRLVAGHDRFFRDGLLAHKTL
jgi:hypothetical protein